MKVNDPLFINPEKNPYARNVHAFLQREYEIKCIRRRIDLGKYKYDLGILNKDIYYNHRIKYEQSGLYCIYILVHLIK